MAEEKLPAVGISGNRNVSWNIIGKTVNHGHFEKTRDLRLTSQNCYDSAVTEKKESRLKMDMAIKAPRPTRLSHFEWKPKSKTLRITLDSGSRRKVEWVGLASLMGLKLIPEMKAAVLWASRFRSPTAQRAITGGGWPFGHKKLPVHHFCVGEASGTKETQYGVNDCDQPMMKTIPTRNQQR
jgi:hypothetical protein